MEYDWVTPPQRFVAFPVMVVAATGTERMAIDRKALLPHTFAAETEISPEL